jgi:cutinase
VGPDSPILGAKDIVKRLNAQSKACPDQKFGVMGYSQGAAIMHSALGAKDSGLDPGVLSKIVGGAMFGDPRQGGGAKGRVPDFPESIVQKIKINCATGDPVSFFVGRVRGSRDEG